MIRSMTAFASCEENIGDYTLIWEIRTVNHRYLDVSPRLPDVFRSIEPDVREAVGRKLKRGKVDCNFFYRKEKQAEQPIQINEARMSELLKTTLRIEQGMDKFQALSALDVLRWPGVQADVKEDMEPIHAQALVLLESALEQLVKSREREGSQITSMIETRCEQIIQQVALAKQRLPELKILLRDRLEKKLTDLLDNVDQTRLEQELVFYIQKMDVEEEVDRLEAHIIEVRRILTQQEPVGRRLDFLMQELNREANTLGSKSVDIQTTNISVELKVLIEQMREQIQNIE